MSFDRRETFRRATASLEQGEYGAAVHHLWTLLTRSHLIEEEFRGYLKELGRAYQGLGRTRAVSTILAHLGSLEAAERTSEHATDLARISVMRGDARGAAKHFQAAGWLGHAALQLETANDMRAARVLWEELSEDTRLRSNFYIQGLVRYNLSRACASLGDSAAARKHSVQAMHLLEEAADGFESAGQRERAFDCYQVLLTLGRKGAFENLAEGYLGCIRILAEDKLRYFVLQYYEDFQELALKRKEYHAAATLFREAADFARRQDLPYASWYRLRAGETQVIAAEHLLAEGAPHEMAENAYAAAIDAYNEVGAYAKVRDIYGALAKLDLGEKRSNRYSRLQRRLADVRDEVGDVQGFPEYLRVDAAYPEIWRLDVIEWEQGGDAAETMGEVLLDEKWPEFTRRRALLCRLLQLGAGDPPYDAKTLIAIANQLGRTEIYVALGPLEHLAKHQDASVRAACQAAVRSLYFKRSFVMIAQGLGDPDETVQREALEAVGTLSFRHAFDPLQRIFRSSNRANVRERALRSIAKIPSVEAIELLIEAFRQGDERERKVVHELLRRHEHSQTSELVRREMESTLDPKLRQAFESMLIGR